MSLNNSYISQHNSELKKPDIKKMEITINVADLDISQLTSDVMLLSTEIGNNLMHVFKDAYNKGLKSGYVLGHKEGLDRGKEEGFQIGKQEGIRRGKLEGKKEYTEYMNSIDESEYYSSPITMTNINHQTSSDTQNSNQIAWS